MNIGNHFIGEGSPPFIIAELSGNHNGSLLRAKESIRIAKDCGANAVKIQTYTPDTMTIDCELDDFKIKNGPWANNTLYNLYKEAFTPFEWHKELFEFSSDLGITLLSTPFDESAADLLESLNTPAYKIASFELTDLSLIRYVAKKGKPMLLSTGMANEEEISEALEVARSSGCNSLLLFHCISSYPTPIESANLKKIVNLKNRFGVSIGLSDHTISNTSAIAAVALGACAIEKHFTLSRNDNGPDSAFSIEPDELKALVRDTKNSWLSLGDGSFSRPEIEADSLIFRRSLYFVRNLKRGNVITPADVRRIRPGFGLAPKYYDEIIGKVLKCDVKRGDRVSFEIVQ